LHEMNESSRKISTSIALFDKPRQKKELNINS